MTSNGDVKKWFTLLGLLVIQLLPFGATVASAASATERKVAVAAGMLSEAYGLYRTPSGHTFGIDRFSDGPDLTFPLMSDHQSGASRHLYRVSGDNFEMGPGFDTRSPVELKVHLVRDAKGTASKGRRCSSLAVRTI